VLVLSAAKKTFTQKGTPNAYGLYDTGAATATLALQATADGLHVHSMAGFDHEQVRASFGIPADFEIGAVTAIGYFGDPAVLPDYMLKMEVAPRQRKPIKVLRGRGSSRESPGCELAFLPWWAPLRVNPSEKVILEIEEGLEVEVTDGGAVGEEAGR
jgi:hypothetical protein